MSNGRFEPRSDDDLLALVDQNPLAWIFAQDDHGPFVTAAPVRPVVAQGCMRKLVGHVPRGRRITACLESRCRALILILGPHGYVSPSWMRDREWAPTWNFTSVQFATEMDLVDEPAFLEEHLCELTTAMERGRERAWQLEELGARMQRLAKRIVAFEARILGTQSRFKLGQDESDETFRDIVEALEHTGNAGLLEWMQGFNPDRK